MTTREERLNQFTCDGTPPADQPMELLCEDKSGTYVLPFACHWKGLWVNSKSGAEIDAVVVGWRTWNPVVVSVL